MSPISSLASELSSIEIQRVIPAFEKRLIENMTIEAIPGIAASIVSRDHIHYLKTFGIKQFGNQEEIMPSTVFQVASISKSITATLLAILNEQRHLSFDDYVADLFPDFRHFDPQHEIEISHLMSHSSGYLKGISDELIESLIPRQQIIEAIQKTTPIAKAGESFSYHDVLYGLLGDMIEHISGQSFADSLSQEFFVPLNMKEACVGFEALIINKDRTCPHIKGEQNTFLPAQKYSQEYYTFPAAVGINASLNDLIIFLQLYLGKYPHILSNETRHELITPHIAKNPESVDYLADGNGRIDNQSYGLGWHLMTYASMRVAFHGGWLNGTRSFLAFLPDHDVGIVILTNAESEFASKMPLQFLELFYIMNVNAI